MKHTDHSIIHKTLLALVVAGSIFCTKNVQAALLTYEGFDYTSGATLTTQNGGSGWNAAWTSPSNSNTVAATGLDYTSVNASYTALTPTGLSLNFATTVQTENRRVFDTGVSGVYAANNLRGSDGLIGGTGVNGDLYGSMLLSSSNWGTKGRDLFSYLGGSAIRIQQTATGTAFRITDTSNTILDNGGTLPGLTGNASILLVWKFSFNSASGADNLTLWMNPLSESSASISLSTTRDISFSELSIRQLDTNLTAGLDEIRYGTTWNDVSPIPEPSTWALLTMSVTTVVILRRRRKAATIELPL